MGRVVLDILKLCRVRDNFLLSVIAHFISKHQSSLALAHTAFPNHSNNQKAPPDISKQSLVYGAVPIGSPCCPVFLRLNGIREQTWSVDT